MYIYEVWHFKQKSQQLFSPYIKTFMKLKQQASGWPSECTTEEKKRKYLDDYKSHEGIELDPAKVEKYPGLRSLNSRRDENFFLLLDSTIRRSAVSILDVSVNSGVLN